MGIGKGNRAWNRWAGRNQFWDNYVNKHGFEVEIISENLTRSQAGKIEKDLIAHLGRRQIDEGGTLVNRSEGGDGGSGGYTHTEEWKRSHSKKMKGKKKKPHSQEAKDKLSKALKGREVTWGKPVLQYDKEGNFIKEWPSTKAAKRETGCSSVWEAACEIYKTSGGYIWKFK